jgi:hypothetical protein
MVSLQRATDSESLRLIPRARSDEGRIRGIAYILLLRKNGSSTAVVPHVLYWTDITILSPHAWRELTRTMPGSSCAWKELLSRDFSKAGYVP